MHKSPRFYGTVIKMFFDDHNPPHFHALYGEYEVLIAINTFALFAGHFPPGAPGLVVEWAALRTSLFLFFLTIVGKEATVSKNSGKGELPYETKPDYRGHDAV